MVKKKGIAAAVLSIFLLTGVPSTAIAAQNVTVTLPTFPVTLNGYQMSPAYDEYPVIVYKVITYFPMTIIMVLFGIGIHCGPITH